METCIRQFADKAQLKGCRDKIKACDPTFKKLSSVLDLAGNEVRLKILYLLNEEKELCPCDLSDILGMSIPAISQHLRKLKDGDVVTFRKEGQTVYYSIKPDHIEILKPFFSYVSDNQIAAV